MNFGSNRSSLVLTVLLAMLGCGTPIALDQSAGEDLTQRLSPQTFAHGVARSAAPVHYLIFGHAGDDLQPEVWPTNSGNNPLLPTLRLFGPPDSSGARPILSSGYGGDTAGQVVIDFELPQTGLYLIEVGAQAEHEGAFTFRLWTSASRTPRVEPMQVPLFLQPSNALEAALSAHSMGGSKAGLAWSADELDAIAGIVRADPEPAIAISDLAVLYSTMEAAHLQGLATDALVERAAHLGADFVGTPAQFGELPAGAQTLALHWLGVVQPAVFQSSVIATPTAAESRAFTAIGRRIKALVSSWTGSIEEVSSRQVTAFTRDGALYGLQANWQAVQLDRDGRTPIFSWSSSDYFSASGTWLGESSEGALLPDD